MYILKIINFIKDRYVNPEYSFSDRLYFLFGTAGTISAGAAFIAAIASNLPHVAATASLASFFIMMLIMVTSFFMKNIYINRILCSVFLNFFMFPVLFWVTGGINCGMIFYFFLGLCVATLILDGKIRTSIITLTLILDCVLLHMGFTYPEKMYQLNYAERMSDTISSFVIVALFIVAVIIIMSREYKKEHEQVVAYNETLQKEAVTDSMTTLYNQRYLRIVLQNYITDCNPSKPAATIVMFDIDDFKQINDTYGHIRGNQVLCQFAQILKAKCGQRNTAIRYGGEEFLLFLPDSDAQTAYELAEDIRKSVLEDHVLQAFVKGHFSVSGGIAQYQGENAVDQWISRADKHLYEAKQGGKNQNRL